jgi:hypothetical protein
LAILRVIARATLVVVTLNALFLLLLVLAQNNSTTVGKRVRAAFVSGDLGFEDYLRFDTRRGFLQYNDCNVLQMVGNANPSRMARAISPIVYAANDDWTDQCEVLHRLTSDDPDVSGLIQRRYSRYWHGYNAGVALALRIADIRTIRRALVTAVWLSLLTLAVVTLRSAPATRRFGVAVTLTAALLWAVPYFDPGFTFGFGDTAVLLGLAVLAAWPRRALHAGTLVSYAAGFGAVVVFFEMLTGQLPVAAAWLIALVVAIRRDHALTSGADVRTLALAALLAFGLGGLATVVIKQILALALFDPDAARAFFSHLVLYADTPEGTASRPGGLVPFFRLREAAAMLTYGNTRVGGALVLGIGLAGLLAAAAAWRDRCPERKVDRLVVLAASLIPAAWVLVLPQHTAMHATFMVRILVGSIALAPLALFWPVAARR